MTASRVLGAGLLLLATGLVVIATTSHGTRNIGLWMAVVGLVLVLGSGVANGANLWRGLGARKQCPDCAKFMPAQARLCRHCGYRFDRT